MKVLALDSSGLTATVAIVEDTQVLAEYTVNYKKTHSQTLLPMLDEIVRMTEEDISTVDAIAIAGGPGSFTGLRIGAATAKGLGLALDKPVVHIPTLEGLAYNLHGRKEVIVPIMDARRDQVYTGLYIFDAQNELCQVLEQSAVSIQALIEKVNEYGKEVVFLGDAVPIQKEFIEEHIMVPFSFAPPHLSRQRAAAVAALGIRYYKQGKIETAKEHKPDYLRVSQAERERAERLKLNTQEGIEIENQ